MIDAAVVVDVEEPGWREAVAWAGAFVAGFSSDQTRRSYRRDLECWFAFCAAHSLHPFRGLRRTHVELYLRQLEALDPPPSRCTLYRRVSTLSSWFRWLEDEEVIVGNPAARVRRPQRHPSPQPWLDRNELTDLLTAAEGEAGDVYALTCLLALNGLRVSEACGADVASSMTQPSGSMQWLARLLGSTGSPQVVIRQPRRAQNLSGEHLALQIRETTPTGPRPFSWNRGAPDAPRSAGYDNSSTRHSRPSETPNHT